MNGDVSLDRAVGEAVFVAEAIERDLDFLLGEFVLLAMD